MLLRTLLIGSGLALAACGSRDTGDDQACPADDPSCQPPSEDAPRILTISSNVTTLDERGMLVITAVVTDPDGVDDLIGGALTDPETTATYGAFATSAAEGAYEIRLGWGDIDLVRGVDAPPLGGPRAFRARFFDVAGHAAEEDVTITMRCYNDELAACSGDCVDLATDPDNCGTCGHALPAGAECIDGHEGCANGPENTVPACSDGCSNDGDSYIDCEDFNCCDVVSCPVGTACNP